MLSDSNTKQDVVPVIILCALSGYSQQATDSCHIDIGTWFQPACRVDTCLNVHWHIAYSDQCRIEKVHYKIYNPEKTKVIYQSDKTWDGQTDSPFHYHKVGYYPYEITFYTKDKNIFVRQGKVFLHIW